MAQAFEAAPRGYIPLSQNLIRVTDDRVEEECTRSEGRSGGGEVTHIDVQFKDWPGEIPRVWSAGIADSKDR